MTNFRRDWTSQYTENWMRSLQHLVGIPHLRALEIGCFEGRSACWFVDHILTGEGSRLDCVDPWSNAMSEVERRFDHNTADRPGKIDKHRVTSFDWLIAQNARKSPPQYDFIYLDGDHRASNVLSDLVLSWPLLRPGGILICDDYLLKKAGQEPKQAIDRFFDCRRDWKPVHRGYQWIVRKSVGVEALVVSVDYNDYLKHTLPMLVRHVDEVVVVTTPEDRQTADVVRQTSFARLATTDRFNRDGECFNKGAAINVGLEQLSRSSWILLADADIVVNQSIPLPRRRDVICGAIRRRVTGRDQFKSTLANGIDQLPAIKPVRLRDGYVPSGYFQLWHWPTCPQWMPESSDDASRSDIDLARRWNPQDRILLPEFEVLHLETADVRRSANWRGRITERFGDAEDKPTKNRVTQSGEGNSNGILTAANSRYWPVLRLQVQATIEMGVPLAVVDHGLTGNQRRWLRQQGVLLPEIPMPRDWDQLGKGKQEIEPVSAREAWIKPWICKQSPFQKTIWIDADAVPLRGVHRMYELLDQGPWLTLESWVTDQSARQMYEPLLHAALGQLPPRFENAHRINTGVFGFDRDDQWLSEWWQMCLTLTSDKQLLRRCRLRDQAALVATLCVGESTIQMPRIMLDRGLNWPVNGCNAARRMRRKRYAWRDKNLLTQIQLDHPEVSVVHWMGTPKPWQMN